MTLTNTVVAKLAVAFVAISMVFALVAPAAQAQTAEELQATIDSLMAQINALNAQLGTGSTGSSASVCPYTWTRSLSSGATGADVMALQQFLNGSADTQVSASGAGAPGSETDYYGPATAAAVSNFQVKYRTDILSPVGLVNPTGYFGPATMAKANALCVAAPVADDSMDDTMDDADDSDDDSDSAALEDGGELYDVNIDDDETEVAEGAEEVVANVELEANYGDVSLDRMTLRLVADNNSGTATNTEERPWKVFDEVIFYVDGDEVASFDASDRDNYRDEDAGEFRVSKLDLVLRDGKAQTMDVAVVTDSNVDDSDTADMADWILYFDEVRYFDADDVATNDDTTGDLPGSVSFDIVAEGSDDGANVASNNDDPESDTFKVDEDTTDSDEETIFVFDIEVDKNSSDLTLTDAYINLLVTNPAGGVTTTIRDIISEINLEIDGVTEAGDDDGDADWDADLDPGTSATVSFLFEFNDLELEGDTDYTATVSAVFDGQDSNYSNGVSVKASVTGSTWTLEGLADDNLLTGSATGNEHTLATVVPEVTGVSSSYDKNEAQTEGTISFKFTVSADGDDVTFDVADNDDVDGAADDVMFSISPTGGVYTASLTNTDSDATWGAGTWTVSDGDEATFALDIAFASTSAAKTYYATLESVAGIDVSEVSDGMRLY